MKSSTGSARGGLTILTTIALVMALGIALAVGLFAAEPAAARALPDLYGTVTDASTSAPLAGVKVTLVHYVEPTGWDFSTTTLTDASGHYEFSGLTSGDMYYPAFNLLDYVPGSGASFTFDGTPRSADHSMAPLNPAFKGNVSAAMSGEPVVGANVILYHVVGGAYEYCAQTLTDGSGAYTFKNSATVGSGDYAISVDAAGLLPWVSATIGYDYPFAPFAVDASLATGLSISGTITAADGGAPVAGAGVMLLDGAFETLLETATAGSDGAYGFSALPPGSYKVRASFAGLLPKTSAVVVLSTSSATQGIALDAITGARSVHGRMTDATTGEPLVNANVTMMYVDGGGSHSTYGWTRTDANGDYAFYDLPTGSYSLSWDAPGYEFEYQDPYYWSYTPGDDLTYDVDLLAQARLAEVRVVDSSTGLPVQNAQVIVYKNIGYWYDSAAGYTNALGEFDAYRFSNLDIGLNYRVLVRQSGYYELTTAQAYYSGDTLVFVVAIDKAHGAYGTVTDSSSDAPIEGATVTLTDYYTDEFVESTTTNAIGRYEFLDMNGTFNVTVTAHGYQDCSAGYTAPTPGYTFRCDAKLNRLPLAIEGSVYDSWVGGAVPGAIIRAQKYDSGLGNYITVATETVDADGNFSFYSLDAGEYQIGFSATGFASGTRYLGNYNGSNALSAVWTPMTPAEGAWGLVRNGDTSAIIEGATVDLFRLDGSDWVLVDTTTTGAGGDYHFYRLPPGDYRVTASWPDYLPDTSASQTYDGSTAIEFADLVVEYDTTDLVAPVTAISGGPFGTWLSGAASFSLSAKDDKSGVAAMYYRLDGATNAPETQSYGESVDVSNEGTTTVTYWSVDIASNVETPSTTDILIDTSAPAVSTDATSAYVDSGQVITISAEDTLSGVANVYWQLDGTGGPGYDAGTEVPVPSTPGPHYLSYYAEDNAGNSGYSSPSRVDFVVSPAPAISIARGSSFDNTATISITATDVTEGLASIAWRVDSGAWTTETVSGSSATIEAVWDVLGSHTLEAFATDMLGNRSSMASRDFTVLDTLAPTVSGDIASTYDAPTTLAFTVADNPGGSGLSWTEWRLDGGGSSYVYTTSFSIPIGWGSHTISIRSCDVAGNYSGWYTYYPQVQENPVEAPTVEANLDSSYYGRAEFTIDSTDTASGISHIIIRWSGSNGVSTQWQGPSSPGATTFSYTQTVEYDGPQWAHWGLEIWAVDCAGNESTHIFRSLDLVPDTTAPVIDLPATTEYANTASFVVTATDFPGAGMSDLQYSLDGETTLSAPWSRDVYRRLLPIDCPTYGPHTLKVDAIDRALTPNESTAEYSFFVDDTIEPTATSEMVGSAPFYESASVRLAAEDNAGGSGVETIAWRLENAAGGPVVDSGTADSAATTVTVSNIGDYVLYYHAVDKAGNEGADVSRTFSVDAPPDTTKPVTSANNLPSYAANSGATIVLSPTDAGGSGVKSTLYAIADAQPAPGSGSWIAGTSVAVPATAGVYRLWFYSVDNADNSETPKSVIFEVLAPVVQPPVVVKTAVIITKSPSKSSVSLKRKRGKAVYTLAATLRGSSGAPLAGTAVILQTSKNGRKWSNSVRTATNAAGKASRKYTVKKKQTVYYRWFVPDSTSNFSATSKSTKVVVK